MCQLRYQHNKRLQRPNHLPVFLQQWWHLVWVCSHWGSYDPSYQALTPHCTLVTVTTRLTMDTTVKSKHLINSSMRRDDNETFKRLPIQRCIFVFVFFSVWLLSVLCGHSVFSSPPQRIFYTRFDPLHLFSYLNSWERASIFPLEASTIPLGYRGSGPGNSILKGWKCY